MQKREKIFLYNVLNQEVIFEEYFCNLLIIDNFRNLFLKFIKSKNKIFDNFNISYENFNTEVILDEEYGRADLFLKVGSEEFIFEIKNKDRTSLTDNQPNGYLEYLNKKYKNHNKHLFFLVPKAYKHLQEINDNWKNFDDIESQIFYWQDFVIEIKKSKLNENCVEIDMFYQFCLYWFNMRVVKFTEEEKDLLHPKEKSMNNFNKTIPTLMRKLENIIDDVGQNSKMKKCNNCIGLNYSITINDYIIYFGIDYDIWEKDGIPLNIVIQNHAKNYGKFELKFSNIKLMEIEYPETSSTDDAFGYVVILNEELGSEYYQHTAIKTLDKIITQLKA